MQNEINVLDHGFVHLVETMGGDRAVVQAARVSYRSEGLSTPDKDEKLIAYLLAHQHGTPFEHAVFKFHVKAPIFVARQWFRHRMGSYNEVSARYTEVKDDFYIPRRWRAQDTKNKQGSYDANLANDVYTADLQGLCDDAMVLYRGMIAGGVAKEMARIVLPVNLYTEFYWTLNARSLMHFIGLRSEAHAQWEMRQYSDALWAFFQSKMPWTAAAFMTTLDPEKYKGLVEVGA